MRKIFGSPSQASPGGENEWLSVADMMAGLMVIFLFIAIVFTRPLAERNKEMAEIAIAWQEREQAIYRALLEEFRDDLQRWNAEIEEATLLIRFHAPDVLFASGDDAIRPQFADILSDFYPRYVAVLKPFADVLGELRIEGHTSSEWNDMPPEFAYIENMRLSQDRTRAVLGFVLGLDAVADDRAWLRSLVTANGLSSSRLVRTPEGYENPYRSRRVEFRVRTAIRTEIVRILEAAR